MSHNLDTIQADVVKALRAVGASVQSLASVGDGCPDILVGFRGQNFLIELKTPVVRKRGSGVRVPKLRESQEKWIRSWRGTVYVVTSVDEALRAIGLSVREARAAVDGPPAPLTNAERRQVLPVPAPPGGR